jgi:hypothetical protein
MIPLSVAMALSMGLTRADDPGPQAMPPIVFEGFGLDEFRGDGSIAGALRQAMPAEESPAIPLDIVVRGPTGPAGTVEPLATEVRSRISALDISAGVVATPDVIHAGLTTWTGGMRLASDHDDGRELLELRTSLTQSEQAGVFGIELGPRIERRLRRGAVVFIDGKAEARASKSAETGVWSLPGGAADTMVGVTARTGMQR